MPTPEAPKEIGEIPGISEENAQQLKNDPDLLKVLLVQEKPEENRLVFVSEKSTTSIALWNAFEDIGKATNLPWTFVPKDQEERFTAGCQEIICLFSRELSPTASK
ncbi:hypothetical protein KKI19_01690 [Patescibacteria group bacterium]|nr:hypothetical protein [Patescibacteria group bacterium]